MRWQQAVVAALSPDGASALRAEATWRRTGGSGRIAHWSVESGATRLFVKHTDAAHRDELDAEADALSAIRATATVRVPRSIASGCTDDGAYLALEWLDLEQGGHGAELGRALARLHARTSARFGWHRDNTIGATLQTNGWSDDWTAFFRDQRLRPQLEWAGRNRYRGSLQRDGTRLLERIPRLLDGHRPAASLLHGDLWVGNAGQLLDGTPVIYDPATYYGDREADLAMTELFGGFGAAFYTAYTEAMPLPAGYDIRRTLYNLYHVLNHLNLFGASYLGRAEAMTAELMAYRNG